MDARNPLLFRCADLEAYVKEVSPHKQNLILVNKADFLTDKQREIWANYFDSISVRVAFFSATLVSEEDSSSEESPEAEESSSNQISEDDEVEELIDSEDDQKNEVLSHSLPQKDVGDQDSEPLMKTSSEDAIEMLMESNESHHGNSWKLLSRKDLISFLKTFHCGPKVTEHVTTVGLVGYPNVGKSSTINALMLEKKVSVSATPGKTKHFQVSLRI